MNPQDTATGTPQQQVIERLKTAVNVLVTVSNSPSVDQLAAAIGFTLLLNKLGKHATAVFSGDVPSTIEFLKPETTIEKTTDSLRDFIVSLDKSKADKLRYKVEQNVVKIFITPYRTSLSEKDLEFSQGDFNVDAVVALGITQREQLDQAIIAHGRILHDATVITVSAGPDASSLGAINWQDTTAGSLCEMLIEIGDSLQPGLLDNQIATAFLTGIVAQTERFRNEKTTPKIMSLSAQLMAAGANQQLIASELDPETEVNLQAPVPIAVAAAPAPEAVLQDAPKVETADGSLTIDHKDEKESELKLEDPDEENQDPSEIAIDEHGNMSTAAQEAEAAAEAAEAAKEQAAQAAPGEPVDKVKQRHRLIEPLPGEPGQETDAQRFAGGPHPFSAGMSEDGLDEPATDPLTTPEPIMPSVSGLEAQTAPTTIDEPVAVLPPSAVDAPAGNPTLLDLEKSIDSPHVTNDPTTMQQGVEPAVVDGARDAVTEAINATPYDPARSQPLVALNASPLDLGMDSIAPPSADPVLAGLGLTDTITPPSDTSILPPAPEPTPEPQPAEEPSGPPPPPVPPPFQAV